jgi:hypothetical protein
MSSSILSSTNPVSWFLVPILYRAIVLVRFKFRFFHII